MRGDFRELCNSDAGRAWLTSGDSPREYTKWVRILLGPLHQGWCEDIDAAVEGADCVVFYVMAMAALYAAERRRLPALFVAPWPAIPTSALPPVSAPQIARLPGFAKRAVGHAVLHFIGRTFHHEHTRYRAGVGLPPFPAATLFTMSSGAVFPASVCSARRSSRDRTTGILATRSRASRSFPSATTTLLRAGALPRGRPKARDVGFGPMTRFEPAALAKIATDAARRAGVRIILSSGWAALAVESTDAVHLIDDIPHDWLFPRVAAVVHHGGVGTFAEGLRAGCPR